MKKNLLLITAVSLMILTSCEKKESEMIDLDTTPEITVVDGMLSFKDQVNFDETVDFLFRMGYQYALEWCDSLGFTSMNNIYDYAFDEVELILTEEEYHAFRSTYSGILLFNEVVKEDLSFYLPLSDRRYAPVINISGDVIVNGKVLNYKDLDELNVNYFISRNVLKSVNSSTCSVSLSKRKYWSFLLKGGSAIYTELHAQKKFLWGWIDYRTTYSFIIRSAIGWDPTFSLNTTYNTGEIPSASDYVLGYKSENATYATGRLEQWSRGIGYDERCTNVTFSYIW